MRLVDWVLYHQGTIVFERCTWMGTRMLKSPLDAWIHQEIIHETQPEVIVELGSAHGGSTLYLAHLLDLIGGEGAVVSVDIARERYTAEHERIEVVTGATADEHVIAQVRSLCEGRRTMVIHDADHREPAVLEDLRNYAPLVSPGCYFVVEDGIADVIPHRMGGQREGGPLAAADRFLRESAEFERDHERERYLVTYNPGGYLRRR
jgi:cephalosporin hydroxylase